MTKHFPDDAPRGLVQRDGDWLDKATPSEIAEALAKGELQELFASGERGQKEMAEKAKAAQQ